MAIRPLLIPITLSLSSSFTFRRGHEQLTSAAAHRPHRQCCSWEMWMCAVLYTPPLDLLPSPGLTARDAYCTVDEGGRKKRAVPDTYL
jgi:hypothetical protein